MTRAITTLPVRPWYVVFGVWLALAVVLGVDVAHYAKALL